MSEIGTANNGVTLSTLQRPERPAKKAQGEDTAATQAVGNQPSDAVTKPADDQADLSIAALAKKDPFEQAGEALKSFVPDPSVLPNTKLRIDKDDSTGLFVYQSVDNESGEVVKQFPPEDLLEFLAFYEELRGKIVDDEV